MVSRVIKGLKTNRPSFLQRLLQGFAGALIRQFCQTAAGLRPIERVEAFD